MMIPEAFRSRINATFSAEEAAEFLSSLQNPVSVSIRKNPMKKYTGFESQTAIGWTDDGFFLPERPEFILDPAFHAGAYYVQESSSMFIETALKRIKLPSGSVLLDLCASPGGKSTLLLSHISDDSLLVANEVIQGRLPALKENIRRWGFPNVIISNADPADFESLPETFDLVLVDAPCSGEGLFRKDPEAHKQWSLENLQTCELRQKRILSSAIKALKPGGYLVYSTCTYNPGENEAQVDFLRRQGFEYIPVLEADEFPQITRLMHQGEETGYAFYPHKVKGEGFFMAVLRKLDAEQYESTEMKHRKPFFDKGHTPSEAEKRWLKNPSDFVWKQRKDIYYLIPQKLEKEMEFILSSLYSVYAGIAAGSLKGNEFLPDHALALSCVLHEDVPRIELSREDALRFLKKESLRNTDYAKGFYAVTYQHLPIGWVKAVPGRLNNLLPAEYRIRKNID